MNRLQVKQVDISYGKTQVVHNASFDLGEGTIGCLLGPSGCGKTTLLLAIAGFQTPSRGEIILNDQIVSDSKTSVLPEKRQVGMVFQDFALFPNLTVKDNIRFGIRSLATHVQQTRVDELLALISMQDLAESFPHQLSGGQQQRVALARAMAPKPSLLLLDEPFSSLDVDLREQLAREVRSILKKECVSAILVTHDQHEAFAMADNICVMHAGRIQQQDTAYNLYRKPTNQFVADFIGEGSLIKGKVLNELSHAVNFENTISTELGALTKPEIGDCKPNDDVEILVRPEDIRINSDSAFKGIIIDRSFRGAHYLYSIRLPNGQTIQCLDNSNRSFDVNAQVGIELLQEYLVVFKK
ncbi:MAG: ABC transporter ATP-binding protein [Enterobacterales bacterium]|nr:ABC transporter ATP-binding protein [Enterobacterales bacterium]